MSESNANPNAQANANLAALMNANENSALQPWLYVPPIAQAWYSIGVPVVMD